MKREYTINSGKVVELLRDYLGVPQHYEDMSIPDGSKLVAAYVDSDKPRVIRFVMDCPGQKPQPTPEKKYGGIVDAIFTTGIELYCPTGFSGGILTVNDWLGEGVPGSEYLAFNSFHTKNTNVVDVEAGTVTMMQAEIMVSVPRLLDAEKRNGEKIWFVFLQQGYRVIVPAIIVNAVKLHQVYQDGKFNHVIVATTCGEPIIL